MLETNELTEQVNVNLRIFSGGLFCITFCCILFLLWFNLRWTWTTLRKRSRTTRNDRHILLVFVHICGLGYSADYIFERFV